MLFAFAIAAMMEKGWIPLILSDTLQGVLTKMLSNIFVAFRGMNTTQNGVEVHNLKIEREADHYLTIFPLTPLCVPFGTRQFSSFHILAYNSSLGLYYLGGLFLFPLPGQAILKMETKYGKI